MRISILAATLAMLAAHTTGYRLAAESSAGRPFDEGYVVAADGARLYYQRGGQGPQTVVLLARLFTFQDFAWLAERYQVIAYDMRNRGKSSFVQDGSALTFENDVVDLETVRRHFDLEKFSVIGYSYLGKVAVAYALEHPERVERIIQLGPVPPTFGTKYQPDFMASFETPAADRERLQKLRAEDFHLTHPQKYCEEEWRVSRFRLVGNPASVERLGASQCAMPNEWPTNLARHFQHNFVESGMHHRISRQRLAEVRTPVLTIHGTLDRNAPYGAGREWSFVLPNGRLLTVAGAAHQVFAEFPEIVKPAVREFLSGQWPAAAEEITTDPVLAGGAP